MPELSERIVDTGLQRACDLVRTRVVECEVQVRDLEVMADIGVNLEEVGRLQPLVIDVRLFIAVPAADEIETTIDYNLVVENAWKFAGVRTRLIETYAICLAESFFDQSVVYRAEVSVRKPDALPDCTAATRAVVMRS